MAVPLAMTVQNGLACSWIGAPGVDPVACLEALRPHLPGLWGVKVGLCALAPAAFEALAGLLADMAPPIRIWDPILAPTSGVGLHGPGDLARMAAVLLRGGGWVVSPNRVEAEALLDPSRPGRTPMDLARPFLDAGAQAVWLKGGHGRDAARVEDLWITPGGVEGLGRSRRLEGDRRGTGCAVASAWLAFRLRGQEGPQAAKSAAAALRKAWKGAWAPGGAGRPDLGTGFP
jgi:hydroxymethylpyrimidine/phosphomethylpyrimidine kinase